MTSADQVEPLKRDSSLRQPERAGRSPQLRGGGQDQQRQPHKILETNFQAYYNQKDLALKYFARHERQVFLIFQSLPKIDRHSAAWKRSRERYFVVD